MKCKFCGLKTGTMINNYCTECYLNYHKEESE